MNDVDGLMFIFNDGFGVFVCVLVECNLVSINDFFIFELVICYNLWMNGIDEESVCF